MLLLQSATAGVVGVGVAVGEVLVVGVGDVDMLVVGVELGLWLEVFDGFDDPQPARVASPMLAAIVPTITREDIKATLP